MRLPEFFPDKEIACPCCGLLPPMRSVEMLYAVRCIVGFPLPVISGARCKRHNLLVGGAPGSTHLPPQDRTPIAREWGGQGFDLSPLPMRLQMIVVKAALSVGFRGFGFRVNMLHMDTSSRPDTVRWEY